MSEIENWFNSIPLVTRVLFVGGFALTVGAALGFIPGGYLVLHWSAVVSKFQLWRLITCFFFHGRLGFPFLIMMIFLYRHSSELERDFYDGRTSDYLFFVLFSAVTLLAVSVYMKFMLLGKGLIFSILYVWSRKNADRPMTFMFGLKFRGFYLPWVLMAFNLLMGGFPVMELCGVLVGHLFYFLNDLYPRSSRGRQLLYTPQFLIDALPPHLNHAIASVRAPATASGTAFGGTGYRLQ